MPVNGSRMRRVPRGRGGDERRRALGLGRIDHRGGAQDEERHHGHDRPGVPARHDNPPEGEDAGVAQGVHRDDLDEVGPGVGILERVGGVGVEDPAAVSAELLDRLLAGGWIERDGLLGAFHRVRHGVGREALGDAERDVGQRDHDRERKEDVEADAGQVGPEVAEPLGTVGREGARHNGSDGHAGGGGQEVMRGQSRHLREGRDRRLRHIGLPVGIGNEADGGVERQVRAQPREALRIEWQPVLEPEDQVEDHEAGDRESEQAKRIADPALAAIRPHAAGGVDHPLERPQHQVEEGALSLPDLGDVAAQRPRQRDSHADGDEDFDPALSVHQNFSGRSRATTM